MNEHAGRPDGQPRVEGETMKKLIVMLALIVGALSQSGPAAAVTLDFESLSSPGNTSPTVGPSYSEKGFTLTTTSTFATDGLSSPFFLGGSTYIYADTQANISLSNAKGLAFSLQSIDLAEFLGTGNVQVTFTGTKANGAQVMDVFTLDGNPGFDHFIFSPTFSNVVSVSWANSPDYHAVDNINASPVPLPASVWLLGSALAGLVGLRRRA